MTDITLVRQPVELPEADKEAARRVLFGIVDGLGEQGRRKWRRFFNSLMRLEAGEMVHLKTHKARSGAFHRRHMLIEQTVFEAQERFESFDQFRVWLKVGAGFVDWCAGPKGGVVPIPRSIGFERLEEDEMRQVHEDMMAFLRGPHASKYLWPKAPDHDSLMDRLLLEFNE